MKKLMVFLVIVVMMAIVLPAWAMHNEGFTVTIVHGGNPLTEIDGQVTMPFDREYKIRLNNSNNRRCSVRVYIDGALVSNLGDFILNANGKIDLERFVNESLTEGKRFQFVPLDNPNVPDPDRKENGIIKVEFRLETERTKFITPTPMPYDLQRWYYDKSFYYKRWSNSTGDVLLNFTDNLSQTQINVLSTFTSCSSVAPGATIGGSESKQTFYRTEFEAGDEVVVINLKIVGTR